MVIKARMEKEYKKEAFAVAFLLHAGLLILFYFLFLKVPDPPITESTIGGGGTELTIGDPNGEINMSELMASSAPATQETETEPEEVTPDQPLDENINVTESSNEEDVPVTVPKETTKPIVKPVVDTKKDPKPEVKPTTKPTPDPEPQLNPAFNWNNRNKSGGSTQKGDPNGNTTTPGRTGAGDGSGGGSGGGIGKGIGPGLGDGLSGWKLIGDPYPNDVTEESGKIVFKVFVNNKGRVESVEVKTNSGLKPTTLKLYKDKVMSLYFEPPANQKLPERTVGTVTYNISAN